jgi:hypothetical protein
MRLPVTLSSDGLCARVRAREDVRSFSFWAEEIKDEGYVTSLARHEPVNGDHADECHGGHLFIHPLPTSARIWPVRRTDGRARDGPPTDHRWTANRLRALLMTSTESGDRHRRNWTPRELRHSGISRRTASTRMRACSAVAYIDRTFDSYRGACCVPGERVSARLRTWCNPSSMSRKS